MAYEIVKNRPSGEFPSVTVLKKKLITRKNLGFPLDDERELISFNNELKNNPILKENYVSHFPIFIPFQISHSLFY